MYCKFCGKELPDNTLFCSKCGKKLIKNSLFENSSEDALNRDLHKSYNLWIFPVLLVLFTLSSNVAGEVMSWIFAAIGLIVLLVLCSLGKIRPKLLTPDTLFVPVTFFVLEVYRNYGGWMIAETAVRTYMGYDAAEGVTLAAIHFPQIENMWSGANTLWLWFLFILFLLLRSGTLRIKKSFHFIFAICLLIWPLIILFFMHPIASMINREPMIFVHLVMCGRSYFMWMFLRQIICYAFVCFVGTRKIGNISQILFLVVIIVGSVAMLYFGLTILNIGIAAVGSLTFGYIFGLPILLISLIKSKDKKSV